MVVTIYHNPRCSKSRATLELLRNHGVEPEIRDYLGNPPSPDELQGLLGMLHMKARDLIRVQEAPYLENGLDDDAISEERLLEVMSANPILIERPIVVAERRAAIGRPPEKVLEII